jgi:hypothetical protein
MALLRRPWETQALMHSRQLRSDNTAGEQRLGAILGLSV